MEKTLHDVHRERLNKPRWKDEYPSHIMTVDELKEYRELLKKSAKWTDADIPRFNELMDKYRALRKHYVTPENYFKQVHDKLKI